MKISPSRIHSEGCNLRLVVLLFFWRYRFYDDASFGPIFGVYESEIAFAEVGVDVFGVEGRDVGAAVYDAADY